VHGKCLPPQLQLPPACQLATLSCTPASTCAAAAAAAAAIGAGTGAANANGIISLGSGEYSFECQYVRK
jgi:hypothetical protein